MAKSRCINLQIVKSGNFRRLSSSARDLYTQIMSECDDFGICDCVDGLIVWLKVEPSSLVELIENGYIIQDKDLVIVSHWFKHNAGFDVRYVGETENVHKLRCVFFDEKTNCYTTDSKGIPIQVCYENIIRLKAEKKTAKNKNKFENAHEFLTSGSCNSQVKYKSIECNSKEFNSIEDNVVEKNTTSSSLSSTTSSPIPFTLSEEDENVLDTMISSKDVSEEKLEKFPREEYDYYLDCIVKKDFSQLEKRKDNWLYYCFGDSLTAKEVSNLANIENTYGKDETQQAARICSEQGPNVENRIAYIREVAKNLFNEKFKSDV